MDLLLDAVCVVDPQGRFLFISKAGERIFGYTAQEMLGRPMIEFVHPADRARTLQAVDEIVAATHKPHFTNRYVRKDGRVVHIMWSARWSPEEQVRIAVARDVTERKRAESMQAALYAISEAAYATRDLVALFPRVHRIVGELLPAANFFVALRDPRTGELDCPYHADERSTAARLAVQGDTLAAEVVHTGQQVRHGGEAAGPDPVPPRADIGDAVEALGVPMRAPSGGVIGALVVKSYLAEAHYTAADTELLEFVATQVAAAIERKQAESRLRHMARHDPLTDLANRGLLMDRLEAALAQARRSHAGLALLYLDLDDFKQVNDRHGHAAGDALLREAARRLTGCVRESDTVARIGGDEFVVLLGGVQTPDDAQRVAEKIRDALNQPIEVEGRLLSASPSIGIARHPEDGGDAAQLLRFADEAMYRAKSAGGNRLEFAGTTY
jgi:diguanylate cyclase (GGDEF)-like protein/PAS domain S-box-containing protein